MDVINVFSTYFDAAVFRGFRIHVRNLSIIKYDLIPTPWAFPDLYRSDGVSAACTNEDVIGMIFFELTVFANQFHTSTKVRL